MEEVPGPLLDERSSQSALALLELLSELEVQGSLESICFQKTRDHGAGAGVGRSQLQIKLILHSLHPSSAKKQVRALL